MNVKSADGDTSGADELVSLPLCIGFRFEEPGLCKNQHPLHNLFVMAGIASSYASDLHPPFAAHIAHQVAPSF